MFELVIRALCDTIPRTVDATYLFAQTPDNQASVLFKGRQLLEKSITPKIMFAETGERSGYLGYDAWKKQLLAWNVAETNMEGVTVGYDVILHTLSEAEAMMQQVKHKGYQTVVVVAPPFHQPRAFMTAITAALRLYPEVKLYSQPGETLPWLGEAVHSQGNEKALRKDLIQGEAERIAKYQAQGDLAQFEEVLEYLNNRDAAVS
ncbi:YdcF family protein [Adhaeribacter rhizoryzae]|uniref:YdcF family protein n=1 Tax=Adhaeribacter rhizoryzae TaxID=2607907 RepID=A0A5M6D9S3_9BACT|nr:YdcF family protein [Adhaeribacter rhizoryzae]KAA5544133.1 YdcF family protein [Adhaeribacter rhizoryzae]